MRLKKISNKAIAYACVGTLAVSSLAGVNLASVKADEDSKTEAEINAYKEVSVPWMAKEYDPGTDGEYKYLAGIDLAAMVHVFDGVAVDLQLLLQRHGYKLARAAAGDDARRAVFDQKVDQLVKRGIIDMFVLPAEGSHKREYNAAHFLFFHSRSPL